MVTDHQRIAQQDSFLPHAVDRLARELPDAVYAEWVTASAVMAINYRQLANIVNGLTWWLLNQLDGSGYDKPEREVLAYIGPNDVRYSALVLAALKAGYVIFVTSPRNSPSAQKALFQHLKCQTLISPGPAPPPAQAVLDAVTPAYHLTVPSVDELLNKIYEPYILDKAYEDVRKDPFVIMHTSGSTGTPKPIIWTNETCAQSIAARNKNPPEGNASVDASLTKEKRIVVTLPPFHGALLSQLMIGAIPYGNVIIAPVSAAFPTAQSIVDVLKQTPAEIAILVPSIVVELAQTPGLLDACSAHIKTIIYIGGDLPQEIGDRIADNIYLRSQWGATETGVVPQLLSSEMLPPKPSYPSVWRYIRFHPCTGACFDKVTDHTYELVIRRQEALANYQPCFTVPGIDTLTEEYRTKDLFEKHPDIPDLWQWVARSDDIIVFLNGEKTNPISFEHHIVGKNQDVSGALVIGTQRFQAALLLEPVSEKALTAAEQADLIERVWPSIEEANSSAPAHARVDKSLVLVVPQDRRLIRAGKGTYMRGPSIAQYTDEINQLYATADNVIPDHGSEEANESTLYAMEPNEITQLVRKLVCDITAWSSISDTDNFFDRGMDSLQALQLVRALRRRLSRPDLGLSVVYQGSSVSQLVVAIRTEARGLPSEKQDMEALLTTYTKLIHGLAISSNSGQHVNEAQKSVNVLLTGSTGVVGTQLVYELLNRDGINHIYCLNRGEDGGQEVQRKAFASARLATANIETAFDKRITFLKAELHQPRLGLDDGVYEHLRNQVGLIIHAAWPVNFNLTLRSFRPQLAGVVNLAALAAAAPAARFVFVSSVSAVERYTEGPPPERILSSLDTPAALGYGRSKFLAELLVDAAARHLGQHMTVVRVGQVGGTVRHPGLWNIKEWLPSVVLSSLHLGKIPNALGARFNQVDWVPVDLVSNIVIDLALATPGDGANDGAMVFNLRNPHITPWPTLLPAVMDAAAARQKPMAVVSPADWWAALQASGNDSDNAPAENAAATVAKNPALKLTEVLGALWKEELDGSGVEATPVPPMAIDKALAASPALRELEAVGLKWMRKWADEWFTTVEKQ